MNWCTGANFYGFAIGRLGMLRSSCSLASSLKYNTASVLPVHAIKACERGVSAAVQLLVLVALQAN